MLMGPERIQASLVALTSFDYVAAMNHWRLYFANTETRGRNIKANYIIIMKYIEIITISILNYHPAANWCVFDAVGLPTHHHTFHHQQAMPATTTTFSLLAG
jgi:hypothetical protein